MEGQLKDWRTHIGRFRTQREVIDADVLRRFAVAVGASPHVELNLPPMAHWAYFLEVAKAGELAVDGHPVKGDFLPPVSLPRRMFAAASIRFEQPLEIGKRADCVTTITDVRHKSGSTGDLVFVDLERQISQAQTLRVNERQTLVYRSEGNAMSAVKAATAAPAARWEPGPVELFRFSAVTFNAHRIHYDAAYAREEGYPALVVHGPLTATKLFEFAKEKGGRPIRSYSFRLLAPLFVSQPVVFAEGPEQGTYVAVRCDGTTAVSAQVEFQ